MNAVAMIRQRLGSGGSRLAPTGLDIALLSTVLALMALGLVMVASASVSRAEALLGNPFYYFERQLLYALAGLAAGAVALKVPLAVYERLRFVWLLLAVFLLLSVLVPGLGKTVNGSTRWIDLGLFNLQVSEPARLLILVYLAGYLVQRNEAVRQTFSGFLIPLAVLLVGALLMLLQPDFGAAAVMVATGVVMVFLAGGRMRWMVVSVLLLGALGALMIWAEPYRLARLYGFLDPWSDPYNDGFQLVQSLIAIGRGGWFGEGLGASVQKLFYLPEAHTDFIFAVLAEELGILGITLLVGLYGFVVWRAFAIAAQADRAGFTFGALLAYGVGTWIGIQAVINMGVNMGLLPTKGLTLPLISYGGSSMLVTCAALGLLLRVHYEVNRPAADRARSKPGGAR